VYERLGISENNPMKLLISALFTLLLIGFAGGSYDQTVETINYANAGVCCYKAFQCNQIYHS
jgi:hypothetical protein